MKKINLILAFVFLLQLSSSIKAQWSTVSTAGIENNCTVTKYFADGADLYAYIAPTGVFKSVDGGDTWTLFNTGLPANVPITAFTSDATKIYVAANKDGLYSSNKSAASFSKIGTVPNLTNNFTALACIADTVYLGVFGSGVYKCVVPTATYTTINTGTNWSNSVNALAVAEIAGEKRLYAGSSFDNGFYVKNKDNDTWVQKVVFPTIESSKKVQVKSLYVNGGTVIIGGTFTARGLVWKGSTTDFDTFTFNRVDSLLPNLMSAAVAFDGTHIYVANTKAVWKSTDVNTLPVSYSQAVNGLQSALSPATDLLYHNSKLWAAQPTGGYMSDNAAVSWTRKLKESSNLAVINGFLENAGKLYANTSSGVYVSASGNGGDWVRFGTGINGNVPSNGLSFGGLGTFVTCDGALYKMNGTNWESVQIDIPNSILFDHPMGATINDIAQFDNGVKTCLFGGNWRSAGVYRYDGTTWDVYSERSPYNDGYDSDGIGEVGYGLQQAHDTDSTQLGIALKFFYDADKNLLFSFGKNAVQISKDFGDNWEWRLQDYKLRFSQGNIRAVAFKTIDTKKYMYLGTDITFGGAYNFARSEYSPDPLDSIAISFTNLSSAMPIETRGIVSMENSPMMFLQGTYTNGTTYVWVTTQIYFSPDNGETAVPFETGITTKVNIRSMGQFGDYILLGTNTNEIQRYNTKLVPTFLIAPSVNPTTSTTAQLTAASSITGKMYYVVVPKASAAPSVSQIIAGLNAANQAPVAAGTVDAINSTEVNASIAGLTVSTEYTLYAVTRSETLINSAVVSADFSTINVAVNLVLENNVLYVFPNPTQGIIHLNGIQKLQIKVYTVQGSLIEQIDGQNSIDLSAYAKGVYLIHADDKYLKVIKN